jgi:hypothetical protein
MINFRHGPVIRRVTVASIFVLALGAGASVSSNASASGPTKAAFLNRANAVCTNGVNARSAAMEAIATEIVESGRKTSIKSERRQLVEGAIAPIERKMVARLGRLTPPVADEELIGRIVGGLGQGIKKIEAEPELAFQPVPVTHADVLAERYGMPECRV